jgi:hypothetical protein
MVPVMSNWEHQAVFKLVGSEVSSPAVWSDFLLVQFSRDHMVTYLCHRQTEQVF